MDAGKQGGPTRRNWRKLYIGGDEAIREVRALEVTTGNGIEVGYIMVQTISP